MVTFCVHSGANSTVSGSSGSGKTPDEAKTENPAECLDGKEKSSKKRWFNLNLKGSDKKVG